MNGKCPYCDEYIEDEGANEPCYDEDENEHIAECSESGFGEHIQKEGEK